jgi:hypothetical protein
MLAALLATALTVITPPETSFGYVARKEVSLEEAKRMGASTEAIVRSYFRDLPIMIEIARCESTFRHYLADGSVLRGRVDRDDTGVMQINQRYHHGYAAALGLNLEDIYHNLVYARYLYETEGTRPWNASAPCWRRTLAANN